MNVKLPQALLALCMCYTTLCSAQELGGPTCDTAVLYCSDTFNTPFDNCHGGSTDPNCVGLAEVGPFYDCLGDTAYPTWFFLQINQAGDVNLTISQNTDIADDGTLLGQPLDVDFIVWGPFDSEAACTITDLSAANVVDCSYSVAEIENVVIPDAALGEVYIFMVTNPAADNPLSPNMGAGEIFIEQTNTGEGQTECFLVDVALGPDIEACEGEIVLLDATAQFAVNYEWFVDTGVGFEPIPNTEGLAMIEVTTSGTYQVIGTNALGDTGTDYIEVTFSEIPVASTPNDLDLCDNFVNDGSEPFDLSSQDLIILNGQDEAIFEVTYYETAVDADAGTNPIATPDTYVNINNPQMIFVRLTNVNNANCYDTTQFEIEVYLLPEFATPPVNIFQCADDPGVNGIPIQNQATFDLTAQSNASSGGVPGVEVFYYETFPDAEEGINPILDPENYVNNANPQTVFTSITDQVTGCVSIVQTIDLMVAPLPYVFLDNSDGLVCLDATTGDILDPTTLDGTVDEIIAGVSYTYTWQLDGQFLSIQPVIPVAAPGVYDLTVTALFEDPISGVQSSCDYMAQTTYQFVSAPIFEAEVVEDPFYTGGLYTIEVFDVTGFGNGEGVYEFAIDDGAFQSGLTFTNVLPGEHVIYGRRVDGNCAIYQVALSIIDYPRYFTPNQDGYHDTWNIYGLNTAVNRNALILIFNRYGKLLKQLNPSGPGWDGTYNGQVLPSADYWFSVQYIDPDDEAQRTQAFKAHFTLKR